MADSDRTDDIDAHPSASSPPSSSAPPPASAPAVHAPLAPATYEGPSHSAPYPMSRMAPSYHLVDVAAEIERADAMLATMTGGKLEIIAEQIRSLQAKARDLLESARRDADLHRAKCNFEKRAGGIYHLYRDERGQSWFSLIAPDEWRTKHGSTFLGSYRLEADMSFTSLALEDHEHESERASDRAALARLIEPKG